MTEQRACPDRATLQALLAGDLAAQQLDQVARHVEACPPCQQALETLVPQSPSVCDLARQQDGQPLEPPAEVRQLMEQAKAGLAGNTTAAATGSGDIPDELAF